MIYLVASWGSAAFAEEADMYAACDSLWASIVRLNNSNDGCGEAEMGWFGFPKGYAHWNYSPNLDRRLVIYPPDLEGFPSQSLSYSAKHGDKFSDDKPENKYNPSIPDDSVLVISREIRFPLKEALTRNPLIVPEFLHNRIYYYRSLSMPSEKRKEQNFPNWQNILLRFHHRRIDELMLTRERSKVLLNYLAKGKLVYTAVLNYNGKNENQSAEYNILFVEHESQVRHFIRASETFSVNRDTLIAKNLTLDFYPFIRTDNLKSLYADPEINKTHFREPVRLEKP